MPGKVAKKKTSAKKTSKKGVAKPKKISSKQRKVSGASSPRAVKRKTAPAKKGSPAENASGSLIEMTNYTPATQATQQIQVYIPAAKVSIPPRSRRGIKVAPKK